MTTKQTKVIASKGGSGGATFKVTLPIAWLRKMGVNENNLDIELEYDESVNVIKIRKPYPNL